MSNLQKLSVENLEQKTEISLYKGELTTPVVIQSIARIKKSFPSLPVGFYEVLSERLKDNGFSDERLMDSIKNVIDTCVYPTPTIAQFISWDKRIKVYTYEEMLKKWDDGMGRESYKPIKFDYREKIVWVDVDDIKKYNIKSA